MWGEGRAPVTRTVTVLSVLHTAPPQATVRTTNMPAGGFVLQPRPQVIQPRPQLIQPRSQLIQTQPPPVLLYWGTPHLPAVTRHSYRTAKTFSAGMIPTAHRAGDGIVLITCVYILLAILLSMPTQQPRLHPSPGQKPNISVEF